MHCLASYLLPLPLLQGSLLSAGIHLITFVQYDAGFTYRRIIVSPKRIASWSSLGMQNMHINDLQLRSSLNVQSLYAPHLRLNGKGKNGLLWDHSTFMLRLQQEGRGSCCKMSRTNKR